MRACGQHAALARSVVGDGLPRPVCFPSTRQRRLTLGGRNDGDVAGLAADVVDDGALHDRHDKVRALAAHLVRHTLKLVEEDGAAPTLNCCGGEKGGSVVSCAWRGTGKGKPAASGGPRERGGGSSGGLRCTAWLEARAVPDSGVEGEKRGRPSCGRRGKAKKRQPRLISFLRQARAPRVYRASNKTPEAAHGRAERPRKAKEEH